MSERHHEQHDNEPVLENGELEQKARERLNEVIERGKDVLHDDQEKINEARHEVKVEALSRDEVLASQNEAEPESHQMPIDGELKGMAYQRTLKRISKDLSVPERVFSRVIHNKAVESISEAAAKTVARPSGILAGGFFAFVGSSLFLWVSKHYGYEYNFLLFAMFFGAGFGLGLLIELFVRTGQKLKKK